MSSYIACGAEEVRVPAGQSIRSLLTDERKRFLGVPEKFSVLADGEKVDLDYVIGEDETVTIEQEESGKGAKTTKGGKKPTGGKKPC